MRQSALQQCVLCLDSLGYLPFCVPGSHKEPFRFTCLSYKDRQHFPNPPGNPL